MWDDTLEDSTNDPSSALEVAERFEQVASLLSEDELRLLMRHYCDGLSLSDLAIECETTSGAMNAMIYRIKKRVRESLGIPANSETKERVKL